MTTNRRTLGASRIPIDTVVKSLIPVSVRPSTGPAHCAIVGRATRVRRACIANSILVTVRLIWVRHRGAVVVPVLDTVCIGIDWSWHHEGLDGTGVIEFVLHAVNVEHDATRTARAI